MKPKRRSRSTWDTQVIANARRILRRVEELDTCGCWDFESIRNRELAVLQLEIDLLEGRYLTLAGREYVDDLIGSSEQWIDDAEADEPEEE